MKKTKITFEEFCKKHGINSTLPEITGVTEEVKKHMIATYIWELIVKTLNNAGQEKEWIPNYEDPSEDKFELWLRFTPGSGGSLHGVDYWYANTVCGARRVFRTREIGRLAGTEYLHFYVDTF